MHSQMRRKQKSLRSFTQNTSSTSSSSKPDEEGLVIMLVHGIDDSTYVDNSISASSTPDYKRENTLMKMIKLFRR